MKSKLFKWNELPKNIQDYFLVAFPNYSGKIFNIRVTETVSIPHNYWSGGSKEFGVFVETSDRACHPIGDNHPFFNSNNVSKPGESYNLPKKTVLIVHSIFCGKDMGLTMYIRPDGIDPNLMETQAPQLSPAQSNVLYATRSLKSSYGGVSNYRFEQCQRTTGISLEEWQKAKQSLIELGLLDKRGALTVSGRNVAKEIGGFAK